MKNLKFLFSILVVTFLISSCSSDDDNNSIKVKYQISGIDNSIVEIKYTKANGETQILSEFGQFAGGGDTKTISVSKNDLPFNANLTVTFSNTTNATKQYVLAIYGAEEFPTTNQVPVPANSTVTGQVAKIINDN